MPMSAILTLYSDANTMTIDTSCTAGSQLWFGGVDFLLAHFLACMLFLRFTSGATPTNLLMVNMVAGLHSLHAFSRGRMLGFEQGTSCTESRCIIYSVTITGLKINDFVQPDKIIMTDHVLIWHRFRKMSLLKSILDWFSYEASNQCWKPALCDLIYAHCVCMSVKGQIGTRIVILSFLAKI